MLAKEHVTNSAIGGAGVVDAAERARLSVSAGHRSAKPAWRSRNDCHHHRQAHVIESKPDPVLGYKAYTLGGFKFRRDEYFAHISDGERRSPDEPHDQPISRRRCAMSLGILLRLGQLRPAFGTANRYKTVDLFAGSYNATMKAAGIDRLENFPAS
jgi:hypothetical protein